MNKVIDGIGIVFWSFMGLALLGNTLGSLGDLQSFTNPQAYYLEVARLNLVALVLLWFLPNRVNISRITFLGGNIALVSLFFLVGYLAHKIEFTLIGVCLAFLIGIIFLQAWIKKRYGSTALQSSATEVQS